MNIRYLRILLVFFTGVVSQSFLFGQIKTWSVDDCIKYALEKNIQVQKAAVSNEISGINLDYVRSAWYPSLSGSARQNFS